jgi:hypothetical protein
METSVKEYLRLEKQFEGCESKLKSYHNKDMFNNQISELNSRMTEAQIELNKIRNCLILNSVKADRVRINLIQAIKNILGDIKRIKDSGRYPSLQQGLSIPAQIIGEVLFSLQQIISNEGSFGVSPSHLKSNYSKWNSKGLENILDNAVILLSVTKFNNLKDSIDFFTELAKKFTVEYDWIIENYYDPYDNLIVD